MLLQVWKPECACDIESRWFMVDLFGSYLLGLDRRSVTILLSWARSEQHMLLAVSLRACGVGADI